MKAVNIKFDLESCLILAYNICIKKNIINSYKSDLNDKHLCEKSIKSKKVMEKIKKDIVISSGECFQAILQGKEKIIRAIQL